MTNNVYSQADSDYLKSLESEASGLSLDHQTKNSENASSPKNIKSLNKESPGSQAGAISDLLPGLSVEQFEWVLKNNYMGSYLFYKRLSDARKQQVYVFYQKNADPNLVREKILQLHKK